MQKRETLVGVLDKAIAILQVFSPEETILTPRERANRTHLSLPTVYRLRRRAITSCVGIATWTRRRMSASALILNRLRNSARLRLTKWAILMNWFPHSKKKEESRADRIGAEGGGLPGLGAFSLMGGSAFHDEAPDAFMTLPP